MMELILYGMEENNKILLTFLNCYDNILLVRDKYIANEFCGCSSMVEH